MGVVVLLSAQCKMTREGHEQIMERLEQERRERPSV